ncbi:MAG: hypothetical protein BWY70_01639 [Bacteroidetes bacterium ADurb.Bin408]|nr:MAG: hypothetical protein BWY70_01639 [Bacteroidetes bacterium ADurb.Bin408]
MGEASERGFDTTNNYRSIGKKLFNYFSVNNGGIVGSLAGEAPWGVSIVGAQTFLRRIMIQHRIHVSGADSEEKIGFAHFSEITQIVPPVRLRH